MRFVPALRLISAVLALFLAATGFQPRAIADTFNVSNAAGLRAALLAAATNGQDDVIVLAAGTYATGGTTFTFVTTESNTLALQGANGTTRDQVVLDGGGTSRVLNTDCISFNCGAITLRGMTVQNGNVTGASGNGGGVKISANLVITNVMFLRNRAADEEGGAIRSAGAVTVTSSSFSNNTAGAGAGGGAISSNGTVTVTNSTFSGNSVTNGSGGAIYLYGDGTITNSTFSNNTAGNGGGAIRSAGAVTVTSSTFIHNSATNDNGGAINGGGTITNSLFSNNSATNGGAISALSSIVVNNTFSGNSAVGSGAAIYIPSTSSIINSVFYGHSTPAIYATSAYNLYNNLIDTSTGIGGSTPTMVGNVAPGATSPFVDAANGDFRLIAGSLAIDAGLDPNSTTFGDLVGSSAADIRQLLQTDLQGYARPAPGTAVDIGAYEYGSNPPVPVCTLTATPASIAAGSTSTLAASCSPAATSYTWTGGTCAGTSGASCTVSPTVTTTYTVAGINAAGTGAAASATVTVTDTQPPTVPTGLSATAISPSQVDLVWTASTDNIGVTAYKVYRGGFPIVTLGNVTSYSNTGLTASTTYSYTVQACDAAGNCSAQSAAATATTPALVATFNVSDAAGLRAALLSAAANGQDDVIVLAAGTYATGGTAFTFADNELKTLTIQGANGTTRDQVILDGGGTSRVLDFGCISRCGAIALRGLTVRNGNATNGGGISVSQNLELSDVSASGNHSSGSGGAIFGNFMSVTNAIFSRNTAGGDGGAIYGWGTLTNSLFNNNTTGGNGGAIATFFMFLANSTFSGNSAGGHGSAIDIYGSPGDTIFNLSFYGYASSLLVNSAFFGNPVPAVFIETTNGATLYNNLIDTSTDVAGAIPQPQSTGNVAPGATSPFVDAANGNFRLAAGSLAIDAGLDPNSTTFASLANSNTLTRIRQALLTDLDGNARPTPGTPIDIGAYEFVPLNVFTSRSECLFNWAERNYPTLFAPTGAISNMFAPYYYRYYSQTNAYLGTSFADSHVYYFGPLSNYSLLDVGALSLWLSTAGC